MVARLEDGDRHVRFVRALLRLGGDLGLVVIAEGVETEGQLAVLQQLGVTDAQGYLLGRPQPADAVVVPPVGERSRA